MKVQDISMFLTEIYSAQSHVLCSSVVNVDMACILRDRLAAIICYFVYELENSKAIKWGGGAMFCNISFLTYLLFRIKILCLLSAILK